MKNSRKIDEVKSLLKGKDKSEFHFDYYLWTYDKETYIDKRNEGKTYSRDAIDKMENKLIVHIVQ